MVTDEDRKAAADFMCAPSTGLDFDALIEAFVRQRILGYQQGMEEAAGVADGWDGKGGFGEAIATAIRAKAEENKHGT